MSRTCPHLVHGETATEREIDIGTFDEEQLPPAEDNFCHIEVYPGKTTYCGKALNDPGTCQLYRGEALCPTCGRPTCPTCAVMSSLNERLIDDGDEP